MQRAVLVAVVLAASACAVDLGSADGSATTVSRAYAIDGAGEIVGQSGNDAAYRSISDNDSFVALPRPAGVTAPLIATSIAPSGEIIGNTDNPSRPIFDQAYEWPASVVAPLTLTGIASASDLNNAGVIVGTFWASSGSGTFLPHAVRWDPTTSTAIPLPDGGSGSNASAINDHGDIVGDQIVNGIGRAVRWSAPAYTLTVLDATDPQSTAADIDRDGKVLVDVGPPSLSGFEVLDASGATVVPLTSAPGETLTIGNSFNDAGVVVGDSADSTTATVRRAFEWTAAGGFENLGALDSAGSHAASISNCGVPVGWSANAAGTVRAVRYGPADCPA
jgi:uncharacterized membrane protein